MRLRVGLLLVVLLTAALVLAFLPGDPAPDRPDDRGTLSAEEAGQPRQTSDGEAGEIAEPISPYLRYRPRIKNEKSWRMAPGVQFRRWDQYDPRGRIRAYLVTINLKKPGVSLDYGSGGTYIPDRAPTSTILRAEGPDGVAAVNGGFFDIFDTGAPLGVGQDRQRGFLHAARYTWNNAFWIDAAGTPTIGTMPLEATILEYPQMEIANVNSARARAGSIGVWDSQWGTTSGYSITDGQKQGVRMVVVENGMVVANTTELSTGKQIEGTVLVGRGLGADQLAQLPVGATLTVQWKLALDPVFAISGEAVLLRDGRIEVTDDRILHPRTAIGIDQDTGKVLLLAIDGRARHSRGYTMVELARMMRSLGAEKALNLDGGGSTTMVGLNRKKRLALLNQPSDGSQRSVADAIAVLYHRPEKR